MTDKSEAEEVIYEVLNADCIKHPNTSKTDDEILERVQSLAWALIRVIEWKDNLQSFGKNYLREYSCDYIKDSIENIIEEELNNHD